MNTNNDVKWRRFIVPKKVEQINDYRSNYRSLSTTVRTLELAVFNIGISVSTQCAGGNCRTMADKSHQSGTKPIQHEHCNVKLPMVNKKIKLTDNKN